MLHRHWIQSGTRWRPFSVTVLPPEAIVEIASDLDDLVEKANRLGVQILVAPENTVLMGVNCQFEIAPPVARETRPVP
jgi:hypothetical protein